MAHVFTSTHDQGRSQVFYKYRGPKMEIGRVFGDMLPQENLDFPDLHVCILRCFKAHKCDDNNIGLKQVSGQY